MATPLHPADVCLLSLERCRALLPPDCEMTDVEMERLRDGLYALAGVTIDGYLAQRIVPVSGLPAKLQVTDVPAEPRPDQGAVLERSSIEGENH
jgi:hypothetical protein